jgi:L-lactate permease
MLSYSPILIFFFKLIKLYSAGTLANFYLVWVNSMLSLFVIRVPSNDKTNALARKARMNLQAFFLEKQQNTLNM